MEGKYLHRNIYKAFVCQPIDEGIATTYEDVDKLIEESTTDDPKTTEDYIHEQLAMEQKEREKELVEWCNTLTTDEVDAVYKILKMVGNNYYDYQTLIKIFNYQTKLI